MKLNGFSIKEIYDLVYEFGLEKAEKIIANKNNQYDFLDKIDLMLIKERK